MANPSTYGAVDLGSQKAQETAPAAEQAGPALVVELTEQNLQQELQLSQNVLVVVSFWADWSDASKQVTSDLEQIAGQMGGQFQLAKASTDTAKQVAAAFRVQSVPAVFALLGGRPMPLFQGPQPKEQLEQLLNQLVQAAQQQGITGRVSATAAQPAEKPVSEAQRLIDAALAEEEYARAEELLQKEVTNHPADKELKVQLAGVQLQMRLRQEENQSEDDPLVLADRFAGVGNEKAAFDVLLEAMRNHTGQEREPYRQRLVELFKVASDSAAVNEARRQMSAILF